MVKWLMYFYNHAVMGQQLNDSLYACCEDRVKSPGKLYVLSIIENSGQMPLDNGQ